MRAIVFPSGVSTDSGWNWTPSSGSSRCRTAMISPSGAVGYHLPGVALDTWIAIRTVVMRDGVAYLQAGAGLVADSDPAAEHQECLNKLAALETALDLAEAGQ